MINFYNKSNNKKGQIQGQIFIYILTFIIAGFIFMFGYNSIVSFTKQIEISKLIDFEVEINKKFSTIGSEYQSVDKHKFILPTDYNKICFLNLELFDLFTNLDGTVTINQNINELNDFPLIEDSLESGLKNNVFIYSNWLEKSLDLGKIRIINETVPFHCINLFNGKLYLKIKGLGNGVEIEEDLSNIN